MICYYFTSGFYMSGLVLYGRALTEDNITSLLQTCAVTHSDELFSMSGILPNIKNGIAITTPTSCDRKNSIALLLAH
jgi:hypothetical protein